MLFTTLLLDSRPSWPFSVAASSNPGRACGHRAYGSKTGHIAGVRWASVADRRRPISRVRHGLAWEGAGVGDRARRRESAKLGLVVQHASGE